MAGIECRSVSPEEMISEIEDSVRRFKENKYVFQVGIKDLDFDVDDDKLEALEIILPFQSIGQAEQALQKGAIKPASFLEHDQTEHRVVDFDPRPVGYSGFMDCVTHSLALTDHGLFEVGRYPAVSLSSQHRYWGWFLHRRLAMTEEVSAWQKNHDLSSEQILKRAYTLLAGLQTEEETVDVSG